MGCWGDYLYMSRKYFFNAVFCVAIFVSVFGLVLSVNSADAKSAEIPTTSQPEVSVLGEDPLVSEGRKIYNSNCARCHRPGGVGLDRLYPPLRGNDNAKDEKYVRYVLENGRSGTIEVNGKEYNGVMPSFSWMEEDEVEAIVAYLDAGLPDGDTNNSGTNPLVSLIGGVAVVGLIVPTALYLKSKKSKKK